MSVDIVKKQFFSSVRCHWHKDMACDHDLLCGSCEHQLADDDKPNGRKDPVKVELRNEYGMTAPYCPSCGEMAYSMERCVFCGQMFLPEKREPKREINGMVEQNGKAVCEKCRTESLHLLSHTDGTDFYINTYVCEHCGNVAAVKTWRIF